MPGAGSFSAGSGPAGSDPVITSDPRAPIRTGARRYEGATRDWVRSDDGQFVLLDPIEQAVALSMCVRRGQLKSAPKVGNTLFEITYLGSPDLDADVQARVRDAFPLSDLVKAGDVEIVRIDSDDTGAGVAAVLYFKNLRRNPNLTLSRASR